MKTLTLGIIAKLTKEGAKDIVLFIHSFYIGRNVSPYVVIENGVNLGSIGGYVESLDHALQSAVDKYPGYEIEYKTRVEAEKPSV